MSENDVRRWQFRPLPCIYSCPILCVRLCLLVKDKPPSRTVRYKRAQATWSCPSIHASGPSRCSLLLTEVVYRHIDGWQQQHHSSSHHLIECWWLFSSLSRGPEGIFVPVHVCMWWCYWWCKIHIFHVQSIYTCVYCTKNRYVGPAGNRTPSAGGGGVTDAQIDIRRTNTFSFPIANCTYKQYRAPINNTKYVSKKARMVCTGK